MSVDRVENFLRQLRMNQYCYKVEHSVHHRVIAVEVFCYEDDKEEAEYFVECLLDEIDDVRRPRVKLTTYESMERKRKIHKEPRHMASVTNECTFEAPKFRCYDIAEMFEKLRKKEQIIDPK